MELTRRDFFKATGAAVVTTAIVVATYSPLAAFPECPRQVAFKMKDKLVRDFQEIEKVFPAKHNLDRSRKYTSWRSTPLGKQWMEDLDIFTNHITHNIPGPDKTFKETCGEVRMIICGELRDGTKINVDIMTCTEAAFAVCLLRDCIKNYKIPIIYSNCWKEFTRKYARYVMTVV